MFWQRKQKKSKKQKATPAPAPASKKKGRGPSVAMEVKLAAVDALAAGLTSLEVAELVGVSHSTILKWRRVFAKGGIDAFRRSPSRMGVRKRCKVLEERIVAHRQEHPERGVRRIRDDLRRQEGLETSAETVRTVVNESGLSNPAIGSKRRPVQVRRFERSVPNALWQIDIFTFKLKRMYPVYLVGIIDDHSRYIVGHGLGVPSDQCILTEGECACSDAAVSGGAWTWCYNQNLYGKCDGERFCSTTGLTPCSAQSPGEEVCNGVDDDCDGDTDEGATDSDGDGQPDCMDEDDDGDNIADFSDNCPTVSNPGQEDLDLDGEGDACETDTDGDGDPDSSDCKPLDPTIFHGNEELCDGIDNDCIGGVPTDENDNDGDGVRGCEGDCNDSNDAVHPGAPEICSTSYDDDCDGDNNDPNAVGCQAYNIDQDSDSYGGMETQCRCFAEAPYTVTNSNDCDDTSGLINPAAGENCDIPGDENCNGVENEQGALGCVQYYLDADDDGFGTSSSICACGPLDQYTAENMQDCQDSNQDVNPSEDEDCLTAADDNCNGTANDVGAENCGEFYEDVDDDGYGVGTPVCICEAESIYRAPNAEDCDDTDSAVYPGATEKCSTAYDDNCNGDTDEPGAQGCTTFWVDSDGDGFAGTEECHCEGPPGSSDTLDDCCDTDPNAKPGQTSYFEQPRTLCGGFDYNCDGQEEKQQEASCVSGLCNAGVGWFQSTPSCGGTANWCMNCSECQVCIGSIVQQTQTCR